MLNLFFDNQLINASIKKILEKNLAAYSNIMYAYAIMNKRNPADFSIISNKMDWFDIYIKNKFQFTDPVLIAASHRITPFSWGENIVINSGIKDQKIFDMARNYNIINGHTFVLHDHNHNLVVLSIMTNENCEDNTHEKIDENKNNIQMLLMTIHEKLFSLYKDASRSSDFNKLSNKYIFSRRENEVIYWASFGKTYQEIALILEIKLTTVKHHIGSVVKKLDVTNAKHAISLSVKLQLIRPVH